MTPIKHYLDLYKQMVLIRELESTFWKMAKDTGEISDLHLNRGEEAIHLGVCAALNTSDYILTHHRVISAYIAKGGQLQPLVDEILGHSTGIVGGRSGEMHIRDPSIGYIFSHQLVGTGAPVAAGVAWASRYVLKENKVTALFIGDAATSNAQFHEGMNAAAIQKVPLLVVIEDNHTAGNISPNYYLPDNIKIEDRFKAYGIQCFKVDGNKIDHVITVATTAIDIVRNSPRPVALICDTTRLAPHKIGQGDIRTPEQITELSKRDPIPYTEKLLGLSEQQINEIKDYTTKTITEAIEKAHAAPWPIWTE